MSVWDDLQDKSGGNGSGGSGAWDYLKSGGSSYSSGDASRNEVDAREDVGVPVLASIVAVTGVLATTAAIFFGTLYAVKPGAGLKANPAEDDERLFWEAIESDRRQLASLNKKADLLHKNYKGKFGPRYDIWPEYAVNKAMALDSQIVELTYMIDYSIDQHKRRAGAAKNPLDLTVANTILEQMGGAGRLRAMIGAKDFIGSADSLTFKFTAKGRLRANALRVTLMPDDTYNVEFLLVSTSAKRPLRHVDSFSGVYADQLKSLFEETTGLYLTL